LAIFQLILTKFQQTTYKNGSINASYTLLEHFAQKQKTD